MKFNILLFFNCKKVKYLEKKIGIYWYIRELERNKERERVRDFFVLFLIKRNMIFFLYYVICSYFYIGLNIY